MNKSRAVPPRLGRLVPKALARVPGQDLVRRFAQDSGGSIAIAFAFVAIVLMMLVGAAVDYSNAGDAKAKLDAALDSAALTTVSKSMLSQTAQTAQSSGLSLFNQQAGTFKNVSVDSIAVNVADSSTDRTTTASYQASVSTAFMQIAGIPKITFDGSAKAASTIAPYIDFYLLLDNSPSMGVGATADDINRMVSMTASMPSDSNCAFACHDVSKGTGDYYNLFKSASPPIQMRIDVVRQATQQLMDTATSTASVPNEFRMAIYTFGASCSSPGLTTISALTTNLTNAKNAAATIDLMTIPSQGYNNDQCTDYDGMLAAMNSAIPSAGTGTQAAPQKVLFFVSDGVADAYYPSTCTKPTTSGRCQEPLTPTTCTALKNRGVKIAVLYTTYLPLPTNSWYNTWIAPFASSINPAMQACASPGLFFEVSPTQGIAEAMKGLFQKTVLQARLTQ